LLSSPPHPTSPPPPSLPTRRSSDLPYLSLYDTWSSYKPEAPAEVLVASASIHGHTRQAAHQMAEKLRAAGAAVTEMDLTRTDVSDRKSTRLNSSHVSISYAVFCLKK